jgi:DNA-binding NtrC family response regulator
LFYRLHVFPIMVPPLRERPEDIPGLVRHFLARFAAEEGKRIRAVSADAIGLLRIHPWPGNVRQLENAVFRAVVLAETDEIGAAEFPQVAAQLSRSPALEMASDQPSGALMLDELPVAADSPRGMPIAAASMAPHSAGGLALLDGHGDVRPLEDIETEAIRFAISHYRGQMSEVARKLRIGRSTLYRKLESLGLESEHEDPEKESVAGR